MPNPYSQNIFINCPFDDGYEPLFNAIVFTVHMAGFQPRCALETNNSAEIRLEKILKIISECRYGIHDLSRTDLAANRLPRFNMPLELGLDLGCRKFGNNKHKQKRLLILDKERFRYQKFISDLAGQDISAHEECTKKVIRIIRDWLFTELGSKAIPGGDYIFKTYKTFNKALPALKVQLKLDKKIKYADFSRTIGVWLEENDV
jgi:hypothetical protein